MNQQSSDTEYNILNLWVIFPKYSHLTSMNVVFKLIAAQYCISSRNQSFDLLCKSNEWFLYEMQHWAEITLTNPSVFEFFIAKSD